MTGEINCGVIEALDINGEPAKYQVWATPNEEFPNHIDTLEIIKLNKTTGGDRVFLGPPNLAPAEYSTVVNVARGNFSAGRVKP